MAQSSNRVEDTSETQILTTAATVNADAILHLRGSAEPEQTRRSRVRWEEGTVDNEFMNKKKSKICCIFHPQKDFDVEDEECSSCGSPSSSSSPSSSEEDESKSNKNRKERRKKKNLKKLPSPNSYEVQPNYSKRKHQHDHDHGHNHEKKEDDKAKKIVKTKNTN